MQADQPLQGHGAGVLGEAGLDQGALDPGPISGFGTGGAAAFGDRGVRLDKPMLLMLRDGKLMRMESAEAANTMGLK